MPLMSGNRYRASRGFPRVDVTRPLNPFGELRDFESIARVDHHRNFVRGASRPTRSDLKSFRMRPVRETARMQRDHPRMNVVTRKKLPGVVENHFVVIVVVVKERHFERARIGLERAWTE